MNHAVPVFPKCTLYLIPVNSLLTDMKVFMLVRTEIKNY